jgi:hypothetical protein
MTPGGWITMILSVGFVTGLLAWCLLRLLRRSGTGELAHVEPVSQERADQR